MSSKQIGPHVGRHICYTPLFWGGGGVGGSGSTGASIKRGSLEGASSVETVCVSTYATRGSEAPKVEMVKGYNALNVESTTGEQTVHLSAGTKYPVVFPGSWCLRWLVSSPRSGCRVVLQDPVRASGYKVLLGGCRKKMQVGAAGSLGSAVTSKMMHHIFWSSRRKLNLNPKFVNNPSSLELLELGGSC
ncbi:hypothetical protein NQ318_023596 [Aromia moschata]|uniref:Uncharacterized protein n=1 Tax=Aromia moschata TaxID=1265417 RepID=A0AAV8YPW5_9CUCU|nr:hypothetical protein NQ318_023596 [Aromia moschata]